MISMAKMVFNDARLAALNGFEVELDAENSAPTSS
jgi:hypothetical protein